MNLDSIIEFCQRQKGNEETFPFDKTTLVLKVMNKMYALVDVETPDSITLKCDPEEAVELRERYRSVQPGYHMSKKHWNTIMLDGELTDAQIRELISKSYDLVVKSLPKKLQHELSIG
jgi:predicted DNA-binding protein (MmcQ/YjbR family)